MNERTPDPLDPYREAVAAHGTEFEALLWNNKEYQETRFRVMTEVMDLTGRVVADIGCGRADFAAHMHHRAIEYGRYVGVDGVPELVEFCRERAEREPLPECVFVEGDFAREEGLFEALVRSHGVEVFTFSGSLNTFTQATALEAVGRAWEAASKRDGAVIFNFLSSRSVTPRNEATGPANRFDPVEVLRWALDRAPHAALRQDYLTGHDATVLMRA